MLNIPETTSTLGIIRPVFFERSGAIRESVIEMSREELIDFVFFQREALDGIHASIGRISDVLDVQLGWIDPPEPLVIAVKPTPKDDEL